MENKRGGGVLFFYLTLSSLASFLPSFKLEDFSYLTQIYHYPKASVIYHSQ